MVRKQGKIFYCPPEGPGPMYKLPPVVGYPEHCQTKYRNPAFSMAKRVGFPRPKTRPGNGALYDPGKMNRYGKFYSPAFSLLQRIPGKIQGIGPGPAAYNIQNTKDLIRPRPPAAALLGRPKSIYKHIGPGPGAYNPRLPPSRSIKMSFRHPEKLTAIGPGPGAYGAPDMNKIKVKARQAKILGRPRPNPPPLGPGPAYFPNPNGPRTPAFSFGSRHKDCVGTYGAEPDEPYSVC